MARVRTNKFIELNISANPHPDQIYEKLLRLAGDSDGVAFGRKWFAKIASIRRLEDGFLVGQFGVWRDFNSREPVINKTTLEQREIGSVVGDIPEGFGYPSKRFFFAFREKDHRMFVEIRNHDGDSIQPTAVQAGLAAVLEIAAETLKIGVAVNVIPDQDEIDKLFSIDSIKKITIEIWMPNAGDSVSEEIDRKIREMQKQRIQKEVTTRYVSPGADSILITPEIEAEIRLAAENGSVDAAGKLSGRLTHVKTKEHPKIISRLAEAKDSSVGAVLALAREQPDG